MRSFCGQACVFKSMVRMNRVFVCYLVEIQYIANEHNGQLPVF